jgi:hypothetical protein
MEVSRMEARTRKGGGQGVADSATSNHAGHDKPEGIRPITWTAVRTSSVVIDGRHRKDMGDLEALADSIREVGLLQPIGITKDKRLVFGERRFRVFRDILNRKEVPAVIVDLDSIVAGEYAENEIRKDFTLSERDSIRRAIEREEKEKAKERQGTRTDRGKNIVHNSARSKDGKSRTAAAKRAGLGSHDTASKVAKVVDKGTPELVAAMDTGALSVNAAAKLVELPPKKQVEVVQAKKSGDKQAVKKALAGPRPTYPLSGAFLKVINDIVAALNLIRADHGTITKMFESPKWDKDETSYVVQQIHALAAAFSDLKKELNGREH